MLGQLSGDGTSAAVQIAVALTLLMLGRRLYWLFVAGIGFVVVMGLANDYLDLSDGSILLGLAVVGGIVGALLAVFVQKLAVAIVGFAVTARLVSLVIDPMGLDSTWATIAALAAGVVGGALASFVFDHALIVLSSLAGAALLVDTLGLRQEAALAVMVVVAIAGMVIQLNMLHRDGRSAADATRG